MIAPSVRADGRCAAHRELAAQGTQGMTVREFML